ncbi:MAG TPA: DUF4159 domain-containing protein [Candidatus Eisenbacteria bacterium]|jgi:hypothetical protein
MNDGRRPPRFGRTAFLSLTAVAAGAALAALGALTAPPPAARADVPPPGARDFSIARLKYGGGGDWYEDRTSMVNLLRGLRERTSIPVAGDREAVAEPGSAALFQYPFLFACGHGNMKFTPTEVANLRRYLTSGGFLWVDDDFGIEPSFRREMKRLFPDSPIVELPFSHPIFHQLYDLPGGLPKIHEHSGGPARAFGIVHDGRLVVFFSFDCDLGDGLEDEEIHHDPPDKREAALRAAINIAQYALTH